MRRLSLKSHSRWCWSLPQLFPLRSALAVPPGGSQDILSLTNRPRAREELIHGVVEVGADVGLAQKDVELVIWQVSERRGRKGTRTPCRRAGARRGKRSAAAQEHPCQAREGQPVVCAHGNSPQCTGRFMLPRTRLADPRKATGALPSA